MYNEIILESLRGIDTEGKTELDISTILSQALTDANHPDTICLGIFNGGERKFEGAVMNGLDMSTGPLFRFTYDWDMDEFNEL